MKVIRIWFSTRRSEISEALKSYKKGAMLRTFGAINKMHRSAVDFEKFFAEGMRDTFKEAWQSHVKVLSSLMDWMTKLLELHSGGSTSGKEPRSSDTSSSDTSTSQVEWNSDEDLDSENMRERVVARPKSGYHDLYYITVELDILFILSREILSVMVGPIISLLFAKH